MFKQNTKTSIMKNSNSIPAEIKNMTAIGNNNGLNPYPFRKPKICAFWSKIMSFKLNEPDMRTTQIMIKPIETS